MQSIGKIPANVSITLELKEDHLALYNYVFLKDKIPVTLKYSQIINVERFSQTETVVKNKSVIGQAIAGQILFGNTGAQVGAIDATKPDFKKKLHIYLKIDYISKNGQQNSLYFEEFTTYNGRKLYSNLLTRCGISKETPDTKEL